ncbi:glycoside hydrolase family 32 protein [Microbacterium hydrocarbonoxydans]|uniref:glycoside hydrolase family 32 protein n=1 Tax=Microbacterium hydrocarbonoxydans TaxID=273678 RepID=UPI0007BAE4FB|nr:glycoside hydrolase family 32 protein [Microbacterium hydrocarbonoxydans]GAT72148.1 exoinulinase [Microbacterium sp. HM58-2]
MTDAPAPRPLLHFAPERNWINDPNGLVFHKGRYHLYYQCNPDGVIHDHLSWGHASSTDLVEWDHHPVAIRNDEAGEIYSGSAVVDRGNTSGLGSADAPALVALYTQASKHPNHQAQALAHSVDDGLTWTKYAGNPVLDRGTGEFRDPKVFRYEGPAGSYWVMVAVEATDRQVLLHRSDDLTRWTFLSSFGPERAVDGVWECPDLFPLAVDGDPSDVRWVLLISLNPGGIAGGSGTQYVIGRFDGVTFTADADATGEAIDWLDFGRDCYAGVTFDGLAREDRTLIAWMSNWDYARYLPFTEGTLQHGMMALPRRLSLVRVDGRLRLRQQPITASPGEEQVTQGVLVDAPRAIGELPDAGRITVRIDTQEASGFRLRLNGDSPEGGGVVLAYDRGARRLTLDRRHGADGIHESFGSVESMPVSGGHVIELVIWIDRASVEVFADGGTRVLTDLIAPQQGRVLAVEGIGGEVRVDRIAVAPAG